MRRSFTAEFKDQACRLVMEQGYAVSKAGRELGVGENLLRYWLKKRGFRASEDRCWAIPPDTDDPKLLKMRIQELERKLHRSEMEKDILKKAAAYFATHPT